MSDGQLRWLYAHAVLLAAGLRDALATRWDRAALGTHADDQVAGR